MSIKRSWRLFQQIDPLLVGGLFYDKLFTDQPSLRRLFNVPMDAQAQKLVDMLTAIVMHLDRMDEMQEDLVALARRHVSYGVKPTHYHSVGTALLWTLQQGLGADWTPAVKEAWTACYSSLAETMIAAAY